MEEALDLEALHTPKSESNLNLQNPPKFPRCTIFTTTVILITATFFIITGSWKINNCPGEPRIPIWMIIVGAFIFIERATALKFEFARLEFKKTNQKPKNDDLEGLKTYLEAKKKFKIRPIAVDLMWLILLVYAIIGAFWLKSIPSDECDTLVFYPSAIYCAVLLLPSSMGIMCICTFCCYKKMRSFV